MRWPTRLRTTRFCCARNAAAGSLTLVEEGTELRTAPARPLACPAVTPKFVLTVSPELKPYLFTASPSWADLVEAANGLRQQLGISRPAWIDACQAMGRYQATMAIAVIAAKVETIRSPGGYLRAMISRAQTGELHLSNSLPAASV
jgi:Replication protein C C-terminal region